MGDFVYSESPVLGSGTTSTAVLSLATWQSVSKGLYSSVIHPGHMREHVKKHKLNSYKFRVIVFLHGLHIPR